MDLVTVREIYKNRDLYLDKEISVGGWVRSIRDSKAFGFMVLSDGSYFETLQIVYHDTMENFDEVSRLNVGAAVIVKGTLVATPQAKQPFEIQAAQVLVEGPSAPDYPLQKKAPQLRVPADHLSPSSQNQYVPGCVPGPFPYRLCHSPVFPGEGFCLCAYSPDHFQ